AERRAVAAARCRGMRGARALVPSHRAAVRRCPRTREHRVGLVCTASGPGEGRLVAGALFLVLALPLLGPPSRDLLQNLSLKGHQGHMTFDTLATGLMLLLAIPVELPFLLWIGLAALGFVALGRRLPRESAILTAMTGAPV